VRVREGEEIPRWLWSGTLVALLLAAILALILIVALALGWNDPRPGRPADWTDPDLPQRLAAEPGATTVSLKDHPARDLVWEVVARPISAPESGFYGYGIVTHAQSAERYDVFAIGGDGYYAVLRVDGDEETVLVPWQQFPHIHRGRQLNRLRVTCRAGICDFAINDEYAISVDDGPWLSGDVGLWVRAFDDPVAIAFTEARLWVLDDASGAKSLALPRPLGLPRGP